MIRRISIAVIAVLWASAPAAAFALSEFGFDGPSAVRPDETVPVRVQVTITGAINALEGTVRYDAAHLDVVAIDESGSAVRLWTERPTVVAPGEIRFSGIIPGGISPTFVPVVPLFTLSVRGVAAGSGRLWVQDQSVYLNQPNPTLDTTKVNAFTLAVSRGAPEASVQTQVPQNTEPDIHMQIVTQPLLNEGARTLVFQVQDRANGPNEVRVRENLMGFPGEWRLAESPYRLEDQEGFSIIEMQVTDSFGRRTVRRIIPASLWVAWSVGIGIWIVLVLVWRGIRARLT